MNLVNSEIVLEPWNCLPAWKLSFSIFRFQKLCLICAGANITGSQTLWLCTTSIIWYFLNITMAPNYALVLPEMRSRLEIKDLTTMASSVTRDPVDHCPSNDENLITRLHPIIWLHWREPIDYIKSNCDQFISWKLYNIFAKTELLYTLKSVSYNFEWQYLCNFFNAEIVKLVKFAHCNVFTRLIPIIIMV